MSEGERSESERGVRRLSARFRVDDIPIVSDVHASWSRWNDPAAKLERRKGRTSRALALWLLLTVISALYALAGYFALFGGVEGLAGAFNGIIGALVFGTLSARSGMRLRSLGRTQLPVSTTPPPLPAQGSRAREPMRRLAESESTLTELLEALEAPSPAGVGAVAEISVSEVRSTAQDAAAALHALATRIQAIERARANSPVGEQSALGSAAESLGEQLDDGVDGYGSLVAAAGRAVAATTGGTEPAKQALTEATDHLAGLAIALRELG